MSSRRLLIVAHALSLIALAACCGFLRHEATLPGQAPDHLRDLAYVAMVALLVAYVVVLLIPGVVAMRMGSASMQRS